MKRKKYSYIGARFSGKEIEPVNPAEEKPEKKSPTPQPGEEEPPAEFFENEPPKEEERREPGQDDEEPEEEKPDPQDPKAELMKLLSATCRGDAGKIAVHLKRLTKYESKKTGRKSDGKSDIESVSKMEAEIALKKLRVELGLNS